MKNYLYNAIFLGILLITCLTGCSNQETNNKDSSDAERMEANITNYQKDASEKGNNVIENKDITIAEFSTNIYTKEEARQTNVKITCGKLNGTIVKAGDTFSFEKVVGKATTAERLSRSRYF